jgi:ABC-type transporter Mla subunit MlaD
LTQIKGLIDVIGNLAAINRTLEDVKTDIRELKAEMKRQGESVAAVTGRLEGNLDVARGIAEQAVDRRLAELFSRQSAAPGTGATQSGRKRKPQLPGD